VTEVVLAVALGVLFAAGTFLVLRRDLARVVFGVLVLSQATNVYLITVGGVGGAAPILGQGGGAVTDPLVQALVLTAVVIGFATTALLLVLVYRTYQEHGTIDLDDLGEAMR